MSEEICLGDSKCHQKNEETPLMVLTCFHLDIDESSVPCALDAAINLPHLELNDGSELLAELEGPDKQRTQSLQKILENLAVHYLPAITSIQREQLAKSVCETVRRDREAGVFGPATEKAYGQYVEWLRQCVPAMACELIIEDLRFPPGLPILLTADAKGLPNSPELFKALLVEGRAKLSLECDCTKIPSTEELRKLDSIYKWLAQAFASNQEKKDKGLEETINRNLDKFKLPEAWKKQPGDDPLTWRQSALEMIDLQANVRNRIEAMHYLYKSSSGWSFPFELPPGAKLKMEGEEKLLTPPVDVSKLGGRIERIILDLPQDLRQEAPANRAKIDRLCGWLKTVGAKIDQAVSQMEPLVAQPEAIIMYGDQMVHHAKGLFQEPGGEFLKLVKPDYKPQPEDGNVSMRDLNMLGYDFKVELMKDGEHKGKYKVTQTIQAHQAPWYAYQNIRALGIEKIGKEMVIEEKYLNPDDFVPVREGGHTVFHRARNLWSVKAKQLSWYYAEKSLSMAMDLAMIASGTLEISAALKGSQIAVSGAKGAVGVSGTAAVAGAETAVGGAKISADVLRLSASEAAWQLAHGTTRVVVGGAGIFNNAWGHAHPVGQNVNKLRSGYFLCDTAWGLRTLFRSAKTAEALEAMGSSEKVHHIIRGVYDGNGKELVKGMGWWAKEAHIGTEATFKTCEYLFAGVLSWEIGGQIYDLSTLGERDAAVDAVLVVGDGRVQRLAGQGSFDPNNLKGLKATEQVLDGYQHTLTRLCNGGTKEEIVGILGETKRLLALDVAHPDRAKFREELTQKLTFSKDEIRRLQNLYPALTPAHLGALLYPDRDLALPAALVDEARKILASRDKTIAATARVALLYLGRDKDGKILSELAKTNIQVERQETQEERNLEKGKGSGRPREADKFATNTFCQNVTAAQIIRELRQDLEDANIGNRGLVIGEVLTRIGALTHQQYGAILTNVLNSPEASREDKLNALSDPNGPRMAVVVDGLRILSASDNSSARSHGLTAEAMLRQLAKTAKTDNSLDVGAMSAALFYGLSEPNNARRTRFLVKINALLEEKRKKTGEFASAISDVLKAEMAITIPAKNPEAELVRERRITAAVTLEMITPEKDIKTHKEIASALAESISPTSALLNSHIMEVLLPSKLALLQSTDSKLANDVLTASIRLISLPANLSDEKAMVHFIEKLAPAIAESDIETKRLYQSKLHRLLCDSPDNAMYAEHYPRLRSAVVEKLSQLGGRESIDLIRARATADRFFIADGHKIPAGETDAHVRFAAVKALAALKDPVFLKSLVTLLKSERDASVASFIRDVRFAEQRIEPHSGEWKELAERTRRDLSAFGKAHPYLNNYDHEAATVWLGRNFPLLNNKTYTENASSAVRNATQWYYRWGYVSRQNIYDWEHHRYQEVADHRMEKWNELVEMARKGGENANKAKMTLYYIATSRSAAGMGGHAGVESFVNSSYMHKLDEPDWRALAARELRNLAESSSCQDRNVLARCIKNGLLDNRESPAAAKLHLLAAWKAVDSKSGKSRDELADVIRLVLEAENGRLPGVRSSQVQEACIDELRRLGHRIALPVLAGMVETDDLNPTVRRKAQETIDQLAYSLKNIWDGIHVDKTAPPKERAERLGKVLDTEKDEEQIIRAIFNQYKGHKLTPTEPGLAVLFRALTGSNERVRLAATKILIDSELPNTSPAKLTAVSTAANLVLRSTISVYRNEAYQMLNSLSVERDKPLIIGFGNKLYRLEQTNSGIKATEYIKSPDRGTRQSGCIYPGGGSFSWTLDSKGEITTVCDDGVQWIRTPGAGQFKNQWTNAGTGAKWNGTYKLLADGEYQYNAEGSKAAWLRRTSGQWTRIDR